MKINLNSLFAPLKPAYPSKHQWSAWALVIYWLLYMTLYVFFSALYGRSSHPFFTIGILCPVLSLMLANVIMGLHGKKLDALQERIKQDALASWDIRINNISVGSISDKDYAALCLQVYCDRRVYADQVFNFFRVALRGIDTLFLAIPIMTFWFIAALSIPDPHVFNAIWMAVNNAGPQAIVEMFRAYMPVGVVFAFLASGLFFVFRLSRLGYEDRFAQRINQRLRMWAKSEATGDITMLRLDDRGFDFHQAAHA
jgi:hypothetical protein